MAVNLLDIANCGVSGNTGGTFCNNEPNYILYAFAVPKGTVISAANMATQALFKAAVNAGLHANSVATRWQVTPKLVDFKDNTKEPNMENLDGWENTTQWLPYDWMFRFANGFSGATKNVHQIWRQNINQQQNLYDFYFVDANNLWWGTADTAGNTAGLASVAVMNITVNDFGAATPKTGNIYTIRLILQNNADLNQNFHSFASTTLTSTFKALTEVTIVAGTSATTSTHIFVSGKIGGNTIGKQFGSTLSAAAAWAVLDNGSTVVPSGVSYDSVNDQYDLTVAAITSGHTVTVAIAAPSVITATPYFLNIVSEGSDIYTYTAP